MLSSVFILNKDATIVVEKQYREKVPRSEIDPACIAIRDRTQVPPSIMQSGEYILFLHPKNDVWFVGVCEGDEFALFGISILTYIANTLQTLLKEGCSEASIKSEYPVCYQILDLSIDYGFPFLDEPNAVQAVLNRPPPDPRTKLSKVALDLNRPWRQPNVKHPSNQIMMDIIETVDVIVSQTGVRNFCHIRGSIDVKSFLSGDPLCKLILARSPHAEDVVYHRCVETDAQGAMVIPFRPPDGPFTLMRYRVTGSDVTLPLWVIPRFVWSKGSVTFDITAKSEISLPRPIEELEIRFELPPGVGSPTLTATEGRAIFESSTREVVWSVPEFTRKDPILLRGSASTEVGFDLAGRFPIVVAKFTTTQTSVSGLQLNTLDVSGVDYTPTKLVKFVTKAGSYEFRTGLSS